MMLKTNRAYSRNLGQRSLLARKGFFMKNGTFLKTRAITPRIQALF